MLFESQSFVTVILIYLITKLFSSVNTKANSFTLLGVLTGHGAHTGVAVTLWNKVNGRL